MKWTIVNIPKDLADLIDERIVGKEGYRSRAAYVADVLRRSLEENSEIYRARRKPRDPVEVEIFSLMSKKRRQDAIKDGRIKIIGPRTVEVKME